MSDLVVLPADPTGLRTLATEPLSHALAAGAMEEVRAAILMARSMPRDELAARQRIGQVCKNWAFAEKGIYTLKFGKKEVTGPSAQLAKELAKVWSNIRFGAHLVADTIDERTLRCWAWDLEWNTKDEQDVTFRKLIWRKNPSGDGGNWRVPDAQELLSLSNANASKGVRNCILNVLPFDYVDDAKRAVRATIRDAAKADPQRFLKELLDGFGTRGIRVEEIEVFVGFELEKLSESQLAYLKTVLTAIEEGHPWSDYLAMKAKKEGVAGTGPPRTAAELAARIKAKELATQEKLRNAPLTQSEPATVADKQPPDGEQQT